LNRRAPYGLARLSRQAVNRTMLKDLDPPQRSLAEFMSQVSERAYNATWMRDLEHALWNAVLGGPRPYGQTELSERDVLQLRRLSGACGGWIVFRNDSEETWIPRAAWETQYDVGRATG